MDVPESVEAANAELAQIDAWLQETNVRKQQEVNVLTRAAFLNGFIAAQPD